MSPRLSTGSSQLRFTAWLCLGISSPAQVAAISGCFIAQSGWPWAKHRWGLILAWPTQENPGASPPSGKLQTMSEHLHPAPTQLILHGGWRLVVSGHSQCLQLTSLGKSYPLTYQQQSRLNYKRRLPSAHEACTLSTQLG